MNIKKKDIVLRDGVYDGWLVSFVWFINFFYRINVIV